RAGAEADRRPARPDPPVDRGSRPRPRGGAQPARGAPRADRPGEEPGGGDPRRGAEGRGCAARAAARRDRGGPSAPPRRDGAPDRAGDRAGARRDPTRGRFSFSAGSREDHAQDAHRRRPAAPHRRGAVRDRLLAAGGEPLIAVAHRIYARALFEAAQDKGRLDTVREELEDVVHAIDNVDELSALLETPETQPHVKSGVLDQVLGGADELVRNFVRLVVEKGRAGEIREIAADFETLVANEQRILDVELTTAHQLSETEFGRIIG